MRCARIILSVALVSATLAGCGSYYGNRGGYGNPGDNAYYGTLLATTGTMATTTTTTPIGTSRAATTMVRVTTTVTGITLALDTPAGVALSG